MGLFSRDIIERDHPLEAYQNLDWEGDPVECMHELYKFTSGGKLPCDYAEYEGFPEELKEEGKHNITETLRLYDTYIKPNLSNPKVFGFQVMTRMMQQGYYQDQNGNVCMKYNRPQGAPPIWIAMFLDFSIAKMVSE